MTDDTNTSCTDAEDATRSSMEVDTRQVAPPDGGWGWVVVVTSFLSTTIIYTLRGSFMILYIEWVDYFRSDKGQTGWIGSLFFSSGSLLGNLSLWC